MSFVSHQQSVEAPSGVRARAATEIAVRDWLETQARITSYWRDLLVDSNGDFDLIEALDAHESFLRTAAFG